MYALIGLQGDINTDYNVADKLKKKDDVRNKGIFPNIYIYIYTYTHVPFNALTQI